MQASDQEIAAGLARGDSATFRKLYTMHYAMVRYLVCNNNGREEDARDIFQEAMVVLYEQARDGKLPESSSLKTWIYAICRNKWLRLLEKNGKQQRFQDFEEVSETPADNVEQETEIHRLLRESMGRLGTGCRKLLLLFYYFRKSMEEVAADMNYTNADNAKAQKYKCIQKLKTIYTERSAHGQ